MASNRDIATATKKPFPYAIDVQLSALGRSPIFHSIPFEDFIAKEQLLATAIKVPSPKHAEICWLFIGNDRNVQVEPIGGGT